VEIRDLDSGQILRTLTCPPGVATVAWSPDGRRLATAGMDFNIHVWEVATGRQLAMLAGPSSLIMSVAFSHAGDLVASTSYDGVVRLWDPDSGRQLASHLGSSWQLQFSPDDRSLLGWQDGPHYGSLAVGSSRECRLLHVPLDQGFISVPAFSQDGRILAGTTDQRAFFWDAGSGREIGSFPLPAGDSLVFPPDGKSLITVDFSEGVRQRTLGHAGGAADTWRLGPPLHFFDADMVKGASVSRDGRHLAVTQLTTGKAFVFDLQNPAKKVVLDGHPEVNRIALSPDGSWAATASWYNPLVKIWDARSGVCVRSFSEPARTFVTFSPDSRWLATSSSEFQLWAVGSWQPKGVPRPGGSGPQDNFTAFSPDGRVMARTDANKIELVETQTEKPLASLEAPGSGVVVRCQFSPDGTRLATVQLDKQVQLWNLRLVRQDLAKMHLDWDLPPYPPAHDTVADGPVTLEIESETDAATR
jgi:WD40 repeat protein